MKLIKNVLTLKVLRKPLLIMYQLEYHSETDICVIVYSFKPLIYRAVLLVVKTIFLQILYRPKCSRKWQNLKAGSLKST